MAKKIRKRKSYLKFEPILQNLSTIHGTGVLTLRTGRSRILWIAVLVTVALAAIGFLFVVRQTYYSDRIYTAIDATCQVNQVPFPTVSICNFNMVSLRESNNITRILKENNRRQDEIDLFYRSLPSLKKFNDFNANVGSFEEIMAILKNHYFSIDTVLEEVHQKCEDLLIYCAFNRKVKKCGDMFSLIKTFEGHCCAFNYAGVNDDSDDIPILDVDEEYYMDDTNGKTTTPILTTSESGRSSGLNVVLNVEPSDYPSYSLTFHYGAKIIISDPNDFPETTVVDKLITLGESVDLKVTPMIFVSDTNVRRLEPEKRACWFHDEVALEHTGKYSFETCNTECKMKNYFTICGCVPYKYPKEESVRFCELTDMLCLRNMTIHGLWLPCQPICYKECRDKKYEINSNTMPFLPKKYDRNVTEGRNVSELASLKVYYGKSACNCYKMSLFIDFELFIGNYGNLFSSSFGGSIVTLFEISYLFFSFLFTILARLVFLIAQKKRECHNIN